MRIGLDFDNTLVSYELLFFTAAGEKGWLPENSLASDYSKNRVREQVRQLDDGEVKWQTLQAEVYGPRMSAAVLMPGAANFLKEAAHRRAELFIVSHKSQFARRDRDQKHDLRQVSLAWMSNMGFFIETGFAFGTEQVFFTTTRQEKVARIGQLRLDCFIDDLPEVFSEPGFPPQTERILFDPRAEAVANGPYRPFADWAAIHRELFADDDNR
jgi:hypothetical protein